MAASGSAKLETAGVTLAELASFPLLRTLAWDGSVLYASRRYTLLRSESGPSFEWEIAGQYRPAWWRSLTSSTRLTYRLCRDGFHALACLPSGGLVAAVPGAIVTLQTGEREFRVTHRVQRGTRPLNIAVAPDGRTLWGEYFDNPRRDEVHIHGSTDGGESWGIIYTFSRGSIRHVHNIVYDRWARCFWILTGDIGEECRIIRMSEDWKSIESVRSGDQQTRAVALVPTEEGLFFASDTPLEKNHIYRMDRKGYLTVEADVAGSVLCGCSVGNSIFFSTMAEPSRVNSEREVLLYGRTEPGAWQIVRRWRKDSWPMRWFQYGNAFLPTGNNSTDILAVSTFAVEGADINSSLYRVGEDLLAAAQKH
jgi:hypothetical protein